MVGVLIPAGGGGGGGERDYVWYRRGAASGKDFASSGWGTIGCCGNRQGVRRVSLREKILSHASTMSRLVTDRESFVRGGMFARLQNELEGKIVNRRPGSLRQDF